REDGPDRAGDPGVAAGAGAGGPGGRRGGGRRAARPAERIELREDPAVKTIYTAGYQGMTHDDLEGLLARPSGRALLVDVRFSPRSRAPHWSGSALARRFGADYLHLPALGNRNY